MGQQDNQNQYLDVNTALERVRGNKKLYTRMLGMFLESAEFAEMEKALEADDQEKAADLAHAIKGMSGNLAMPKVFEASSKLMEQFRQGNKDQQLIQDYRDALRETQLQAQELKQKLEREI